jgi:hypothetical protein
MTLISESGENPAILASDAEREQRLTQLRRHFAEGRLTLAELEERVSVASEARTRGELQALTADLPVGARRHTTQNSGTDWLILGVLLCISPPTGLVYWLLSRR